MVAYTCRCARWTSAPSPGSGSIAATDQGRADGPSDSPGGRVTRRKYSLHLFAFWSGVPRHPDGFSGGPPRQPWLACWYRLQLEQGVSRSVMVSLNSSKCRSLTWPVEGMHLPLIGRCQDPELQPNLAELLVAPLLVTLGDAVA